VKASNYFRSRSEVIQTARTEVRKYFLIFR